VYDVRLFRVLANFRQSFRVPQHLSLQKQVCKEIERSWNWNGHPMVYQQWFTDDLLGFTWAQLWLDTCPSLNYQDTRNPSWGTLETSIAVDLSSEDGLSYACWDMWLWYSHTCPSFGPVFLLSLPKTTCEILVTPYSNCFDVKNVCSSMVYNL